MSQLCPKEELLRRLQRLGFMTDDLRLFLDTHPDCEEALLMLKRYIALERQTRLEYERLYGPVTMEGVQDRCRYDWVAGPWPWEKEV